MIWKYMAGGCLALWLLPQGTALANATVTSPSPSTIAAIPEPSAEADQPSTDAPLPWAELLEGNPQQPLRVGEYNRIMDTMWTYHNDQHALRSDRIRAACDALGSDMRYLHGRVPRQIEDAHRQMAPFQTKGLSVAQLHPPQGSAKTLSERVSLLLVDDIEAATLLEWLRSGEDPHLYENYRQLFSHFLNLNLDDYLDSAQDDMPLSRSEFLGYIETLDQTWQDPTGGLERHERFLEESDRLIQDLLTMLREVRRSLAMLEATKANANLSPAAIPKQTVTLLSPSSSQLDQPIAQSTDPTIELDEDTIVTRRDFLLVMLDLMASVEIALFQYIPWCGNYRIESDILAQDVQWEVEGLIRDLDILNVEIMELVRTHSR